jgi:hypothetical protein
VAAAAVSMVAATARWAAAAGWASSRNDLPGA